MIANNIITKKMMTGWKYLKTHRNARIALACIPVLILIVGIATRYIIKLTSTESTTKSSLNIQHWQTTNGARVYFVQAKELPMVDVSIAFDAGSRRDGEQAGLARLTGQLLDEGTSQLDANQIAASFETLGAIYNAQTSQDMTTINLRTLTKPAILKPAIDLLTTVINDPAFPEKAFQRKQQNTLQAIATALQKPNRVATFSFYKALYGNSPYGHPVLGTAATVKAMSQKDVAAFYKKYFVAKNAIIAIVGNLTKSQAKALSQQIMKKLPAGERAAPLKNSVITNSKTVSIPFATNQTAIRIGQIGIDRHNPDYFPLVVANNTLGGGIFGGVSVSRLFMIVREKEGLSYDIGSYFIPWVNRGPFIIAFQTKTSQTKQALKLTRQVVANYVNHGPTQQELNAAKDYLTGSFPLRLDSNSDILRQLVTIGFYQLPLNYLDTFNKNIESVTLDQVRHVLKKYIHPDQMITVVVGRNLNSSDSGNSDEKNK